VKKQEVVYRFLVWCVAGLTNYVRLCTRHREQSNFEDAALECLNDGQHRIGMRYSKDQPSKSNPLTGEVHTGNVAWITRTELNNGGQKVDDSASAQIQKQFIHSKEREMKGTSTCLGCYDVDGELI
jgi:hypothetical protein